jgi:hypothetical protein
VRSAGTRLPPDLRRCGRSSAAGGVSADRGGTDAGGEAGAGAPAAPVTRLRRVR